MGSTIEFVFLELRSGVMAPILPVILYVALGSALVQFAEKQEVELNSYIQILQA